MGPFDHQLEVAEVLARGAAMAGAGGQSTRSLSRQQQEQIGRNRQGTSKRACCTCGGDHDQSSWPPREICAVKRGGTCARGSGRIRRGGWVSKVRSKRVGASAADAGAPTGRLHPLGAARPRPAHPPPRQVRRSPEAAGRGGRSSCVKNAINTSVDITCRPQAPNPGRPIVKLA